MRRLIWWVRRDLRLDDNTALAAALDDADEIVPVFVLDDRLLSLPRVRGPRIAWMLDGLRALNADLCRYESSLVVRRGDPAQALLAVCRECGAHGVYFNRDYSRFATQRDQRVTRALRDAGLAVSSFKDAVIYEAGERTTAQRKQYEVYTPFKNAWLALPKPGVIPSEGVRERLKRTPHIASLPIPSAAELGSAPVPHPIGPAGERPAANRLDAFAAGPIYAYGELRNRPAQDGSAVLSPYLRWGMISPRQCYHAAMRALDAASDTDTQARLGVYAWIGELVWREFFYQLLAANPSSTTHNLRRRFDGLAWEDRPDWLEAWAAGRTGYPIVDAAMRQLASTGWMHNRARLIVASFLCKDLLVDWRRGETLFMQRLLDGDVANNVGNWQWSAGTGADAAPYFRIFNPATQGERFDPGGRYIRRWLPALANVPDAFIHCPEKMNAAQQRAAGCRIGQDYPAPIVDHAIQRKRALAMYATARNASAATAAWPADEDAG
ncbi:MAG: deoxyribodipyrimidine photo-lyase [Anaerolineae bacterium]|nr:deoxyribodipyrimidine photo-lyase [Anaerolineae bacterium]